MDSKKCCFTIYKAAKKGCLQCLQSRITKKNINKPNSRKETALHLAIHNIDCVQFLINEGADVNAKDSFDQSPLHISTTLPVIKLLLEHNTIDINAQNYRLETPLYTILDNIYTNVISSTSINPSDVILLFFKHGADINMETFQGTTILSLSIIYTFFNCVEACIDCGANVTAGDHIINSTPLHDACEIEDEEASIKYIELLLNKGADPNAKTTEGITPLHVAEKNENKKAIELLIYHGAKMVKSPITIKKSMRNFTKKVYEEYRSSQLKEPCC